MINFKQWLIKEYNFTNPQNLKQDPNYLYHGTNDQNLYDIAQSGFLNVFEPSYGTDQETWPDGETEERSYWTQNPATTHLFIPYGKPVIIRTKYIPSKFHKERFTNDFYTTQPVPTEQLEVLVNNNWMPVNQIN